MEWFYIIVPNGTLISGKLTNRIFDNKHRRLEIELHLNIDTDIKKAVEVFLNAAICVYYFIL